MRFEALLDSALEHGSHAWRAIETNNIGAIDATYEGWPPRATSGPGTAAYHLAAMLEYIKQAYDKVTSLEDRS
jgi:hypothetical protein